MPRHSKNSQGEIDAGRYFFFEADKELAVTLICRQCTGIIPCFAGSQDDVPVFLPCVWPDLHRIKLFAAAVDDAEGS